MSRIDHKSGFGFNTDSDNNKNYFIKRNNIEYQVNLEQIPYYVQQNLGLISTYSPQPLDGSISSVDNNTGLIYSIDNSVEYVPFTIFDPVSRYGFIGTVGTRTFIAAGMVLSNYYFKQDSYGVQPIVYNLPEDVKTLLQTGIRDNISSDFILPIRSISEEIPNIIIEEEEDKTKGFGFNIDSNGKKNYFITRNFSNYQVNLEQIPFNIQENLGLRSPNEARSMPGASYFSFDSNRGLIYSVNGSIQYGPFSIFDPVSRYGFSGYRFNPPNNPHNKDHIYYFTQNEKGIQSKVASYFLPEHIKNNLQNGIRDNISQDFILPEEQTPTFINSKNDPRCPSDCWNCECDPEKKKLSQKLYEDVQNNPDPKYPMGCSEPQIKCSCVNCSLRPTFTPDVAPVYIPSIAPRPEGLTDPKGPSAYSPSIVPAYSPRVTPAYRPRVAPKEENLSFWKQYEYIISIVVVLVIIMIIFLFMSGGKREEEE
jgi:hypothetical protein